MPQEIRQEVFSEVRYGFNNRYSGFFTHVQETANDVLDVYDPEHATLETRRENRIKRENDKFDDEYYM
jgi:protein SHQ1